MQTALIEENARAVDQWIEIYFPSDTIADNLELWTLGPTVFYEVEILRVQSRRYRNREVELGKKSRQAKEHFQYCAKYRNYI